MERTKKDFIKELLITAQDNIWKNELTLLYAEKTPEDKEKAMKIKATEHAIKKDKEYLEFLTTQL